ncbi:hypothetical protein JCM8547_005387 [Rhodosporidiobolus lusitaniae]
MHGIVLEVDDEAHARLATPSQSASLLTPAEVGYNVCLTLYGVFMYLAFGYWRSPSYSKASKPVRAVLWATTFSLTVYVGLCFADGIYWQIEQERTLGKLLAGNSFEPYFPLVGGTVAALVQSLLVFRAAAFLWNRQWRMIFLVVMGVGIFVGFSGSVLACAAVALRWYGHADRLHGLNSNDFFAWWSLSSAVVDVGISASLGITLHRRIAGFNQHTDSLLKRLVVGALQTAAYTSVIAVVAAALAFSYKDTDHAHSYVTAAFWSILPPLYGISLWTTLAQRKSIEQQMQSSAWHVGVPTVEARRRAGNGGGVGVLGVGSSLDGVDVRSMRLGTQSRREEGGTSSSSGVTRREEQEEKSKRPVQPGGIV